MGLSYDEAMVGVKGVDPKTTLARQIRTATAMNLKLSDVRKLALKYPERYGALLAHYQSQQGVQTMNNTTSAPGLYSNTQPGGNFDVNTSIVRALQALRLTDGLFSYRLRGDVSRFEGRHDLSPDQLAQAEKAWEQLRTIRAAIEGALGTLDAYNAQEKTVDGFMGYNS